MGTGEFCGFGVPVSLSSSGLIFMVRSYFNGTGVSFDAAAPKVCPASVLAPRPQKWVRPQFDAGGPKIDGPAPVQVIISRTFLKTYLR